MLWLLVVQWITLTCGTRQVYGRQVEAPSRQCCPDDHFSVWRHNCSNGSPLNINCKELDSSLFMILGPNDYKIRGRYLFVLHRQNGLDHAIDPEEFCTATSTDSDENTSKVALICLSAIIEEENPNERGVYLKLYSYFLMISVLFLGATFTVYCIVPSLRDLQGKCVMCFIACLAIGYLSLAILQQNFFDYRLPDYVCTVFGFWTYFWLLCVFFWLFLISFNIWYQSRFTSTAKEATLWRTYFVLGFGIPTMFQVGALVTHHIPSSILKPNIGNGVCWFQGVTETWIYFSGPMAVLLLFNLIFFLLTARILWIHYREMRPQPRIKTLRYKMLLYLKLFFTMGLTWIFELISFGFQIDWYVSDILNSLQGPIIFTVMVITRKRVLRSLADKKVCPLFCRRTWRTLEDEENETEPLENIQLS